MFSIQFLPLETMLSVDDKQTPPLRLRQLGKWWWRLSKWPSHPYELADHHNPHFTAFTCRIKHTVRFHSLIHKRANRLTLYGTWFLWSSISTIGTGKNISLARPNKHRLPFLPFLRHALPHSHMRACHKTCLKDSLYWSISDNARLRISSGDKSFARQWGWEAVAHLHSPFLFSLSPHPPYFLTSYSPSVKNLHLRVGGTSTFSLLHFSLHPSPASSATSLFSTPPGKYHQPFPALGYKHFTITLSHRRNKTTRAGFSM